MSTRPSASSQQQHLLSTQKLRELLATVSTEPETMDTLVESALLRMADEFAADVARAAVEIAAHRRSQVLQAKDLIWVLENDYGMDMPGWNEKPDGQEGKRTKGGRNDDVHAQRMTKIKQATHRYP